VTVVKNPNYDRVPRQFPEYMKGDLDKDYKIEKTSLFKDLQV